MIFNSTQDWRDWFDRTHRKPEAARDRECGKRERGICRSELLLRTFARRRHRRRQRSVQLCGVSFFSLLPFYCCRCCCLFAFVSVSTNRPLVNMYTYFIVSTSLRRMYADCWWRCKHEQRPFANRKWNAYDTTERLITANFHQTFQRHPTVIIFQFFITEHFNFCLLKLIAVGHRANWKSYRVGRRVHGFHKNS